LDPRAFREAAACASRLNPGRRQAPNSLPHRPDLSHLRRQAKELLAGFRAGDPAALQAFRDHLPDAAGLSDDELPASEFRLADAQSAVARRTGFASWPALNRHVTTLRRMEGSWSFAALRVGGVDLDPQELTGARLIIHGDLFRSGHDEGEFEIDVEQDPIHLDIDFRAGPEAGRQSLGLIEFRGEELVIVLGLAGQPRPQDWSAEMDSSQALEALRRAGPPLALDALEPVEPPAAQIEDWGELAVTPLHAELAGQCLALEIISDGMKLPGMLVRNARRKLAGTKIEAVVAGMKALDAEVRLTPGDPILADYRALSGLEKGQIQSGMLKQEGGELLSVFAPFGAERPDGFASPSGSAWTFSRWKRS
jgi:uncharacterized protein (TIGR03067 family)